MASMLCLNFQQIVFLEILISQKKILTKTTIILYFRVNVLSVNKNFPLWLKEVQTPGVGNSDSFKIGYDEGFCCFFESLLIFQLILQQIINQRSIQDF